MGSEATNPRKNLTKPNPNNVDNGNKPKICRPQPTGVWNHNIWSILFPNNGSQWVFKKWNHLFWEFLLSSYELSLFLYRFWRAKTSLPVLKRILVVVDAGPGEFIALTEVLCDGIAHLKRRAMCRLVGEKLPWKQPDCQPNLAFWVI